MGRGNGSKGCANVLNTSIALVGIQSLKPFL